MVILRNYVLTVAFAEVNPRVSKKNTLIIFNHSGLDGVEYWTLQQYRLEIPLFNSFCSIVKTPVWIEGTSIQQT